MPRRDIALLITLCVTLGAYAIVTRPPTPITAPDTAVYIEGSPLVPIGYPLLLDTFGVEGVAVLQPLIFAAALALLGLELLATTGSVGFAIATLAGIVIIPDLMAYHASILTESLFVSGLIGFVAICARFARAPSWQAVFTAAIIAGLTAMIRRTAYAFAPIVLLMALLLWRTHRARGWVSLAAGIVPLVTLYAADHVLARAQHGDALTSLTGRHLFAKAALLEPFSSVANDPSQEWLDRELDSRYAPIRQLLREAPLEIRASLVLYYETCLQGPCVSRLRDAIELPEWRKNELFAAAGFRRVQAAPWQFIRLALMHYGSFWTAYKLRHPRTAAQLTDFLAARRPLPFEREAFKVAPGEPITFAPSSAVVWLQPVVMMLGALTGGVAIFGGVGALIVAVPRAVLVAALASVAAHACLVFTAFTAAGISRFMIAVFPAVVVSAGLVFWCLLKTTAAVVLQQARDLE